MAASRSSNTRSALDAMIDAIDLGLFLSKPQLWKARCDCELMSVRCACEPSVFIGGLERGAVANCRSIEVEARGLGAWTVIEIVSSACNAAV